MYLRTRLALILGGLLASILVVSGVGSIVTNDLAKRIETVDQASVLARHLDKIEDSRREYQVSASSQHLETTRGLINGAWEEIAKLKSMSDDAGFHASSILSLEDSFGRYRKLLDAYAASEAQKSSASEAMSVQLDGLKSMATELQQEKESDYHRTFAFSTSIKEAEGRLKTTLRLTALANEIIVVQMSIERAVAHFKGGDQVAATDIPLEVGRIAEIADRIRRIEQVAVRDQDAARASDLPNQLVANSSRFQNSFDDFHLSVRRQGKAAEEMAAVAMEVSTLILKINDYQTKVAIKDSDRTLTLSILGVFTAMILGALATIMIRNRIMVPLTEITEAMGQMSEGQLSIVVPGYERSDELGAMARALEVFRQNSEEARRLAQEKVDVERRLAEEKAEAVFLEQSLSREKELGAQQRRFVSLVSHEFRTPLAIIDGQAQRLIRRGDKFAADERAVALEKTRDAVRRLTNLMESVLSSASLEAGSIAFNPEPTDLKGLIRKACDTQQEVSRKHTFNVDIGALPETYLGDAKLLHQAVTNLLSNAVKYSPNADRVDVTSRLTEDGIEIAVRDFGVGVPKDELPKLSQRFFRASTSTGIPGTGIGLNLVRSLVEMHKGILEVCSIEGDGSTFTIKLPNNLSTSGKCSAAA